MKRKIPIFSSGILLLAVFILPLFTYAQKTDNNSLREVSRNVDQNTYDKVVNLIFADAETKQSDVLSFVVVRFLPSFETERELIILRRSDSAKIIYLQARKNIYTALNTALNKGKLESAEQFAREVKVKKTSYELPTYRADEWLNDFHQEGKLSSDKVNQERIKTQVENTATVILDGTFYDFQSQSGMNKMRFQFYDEEMDKSRITGTLSLVKMVNKVRLEVENGDYKMSDLLK
jgi:hypothetical protein